MKNSEYKIADAIILAQIASEGGKHDYTTFNQVNTRIVDAQWASRKGYSVKAKLIMNAINGINKSKDSMFRYTIHGALDQNGHSSIIVYFEFRIYRHREQVSFHIVPREWTKDMIKLANAHSRYTEWNEVRCGSSESCVRLAEYMFKEVVDMC